MKAKYVNPFTDFGFKKLFGEEASKPALIDFLSALLPEQSQITDVTFKNTEKLGDIYIDRKAVYDIYCENDKGEKFIVELQKAKQSYFKERTVYYSTYPIREQAEKGIWNFNLKAVYCIGILDFTFGDGPNETDVNQVVQDIKLRDKNGKTFYEKLTYIYLEMPNFRKTEQELESRLDKWLYFLKHLEDFQVIPEIFKNDVVFEHTFETAALVTLNEEDKDSYEYSLKVYRDNKNVIDYAEQKGRDKGVEEGIEIGISKGIEIGEANRQKYADEQVKQGKFETAKKALLKGLSIDDVADLTGLSKEEIEAIGAN